MKEFTAWIALSPQGHPAPFAGYHFTRAVLRQEYAAHFQRDLETDGYRAIKVTIREADR